MAEDAARELPNLPLEDTLQLVHLYAELRKSRRVSRSSSADHERPPELASYLRIEERVLEAGGGLN